MFSHVRQIAAIVLVIVAAASSPAVFDAVLIGLILYAMLGNGQIVRAAALSVVLKYLNPALGSYDSMAGLLFWILLIGIGLRSLAFMRVAHLRVLVPVWLFALAAAVLSYLSSKAVPISLMKVTVFAWVVPAVLNACLAMHDDERVQLRQWTISYALAIATLCALTLLRPAVAYQFLAGSLQGIFSHPQSLGTFLAPMSAWAIAGLIIMRGKARPHQIAAAVLITAVMLLSLARTAAMATCLGLAIAGMTPLLSKVRSDEQAKVGRIIGVLLLGVLTLGLISLWTGQLTEAFNGFVMKRGSQDLSKDLYASRGWGILSQWHNFLDRPLLGNGFGVFANGEFPAGVVEWNGIPISAPVEKGFLPTAILEETGIIGACLFIFMIASSARLVYRNIDLRWIAAFWAAIMINLGEAVILAPGGIGLYIWLVIGICATPAQTLQAEPAADAVAPETSPRFLNLMH